MLDSVRSRLALWHTLVLAVLLVSFAVGSYLWLARAVRLRDDRFLQEATNAFRANVAAERLESPLDSAIQQTLAEVRPRNVAFLLFDSTGRLMARSASARSASASASAGAHTSRRHAVSDSVIREALVTPSGGNPPGSRFTTVGSGMDAERLYILPVSLGAERFTTVAVESLADQHELLERTRAGYLIAIPLGLLLAWAGGYLLARRSLAPVSAMSAQAAALGAASLHERLPVVNPRDELGQLAMTFNQLLSRLDAAFEQQRRFMADAAHELRTPVAIMRGEADIALSREVRPSEEYRGALDVIRDEGRRLSRIVGELFLLARADAGQQLLQPRPLYLDELVSDCARAVRSLARHREVRLHCTVDPPVPLGQDRLDAAPVEHAYVGDEALLRSLLVNLLDNAIKHAPATSTVEVTLLSDAERHRIRVVDHGPGIPADARERVFERFYRADQKRSRDSASETGGAGLGLSIARWVAEAHGGSLRLVTADLGHTEFEVVLPRPREAQLRKAAWLAGYPINQ